MKTILKEMAIQRQRNDYDVDLKNYEEVKNVFYNTVVHLVSADSSQDDFIIVRKLIKQYPSLANEPMFSFRGYIGGKEFIKKLNAFMYIFISTDETGARYSTYSNQINKIQKLLRPLTDFNQKFELYGEMIKPIQLFYFYEDNNFMDSVKFEGLFDVLVDEVDITETYKGKSLLDMLFIYDRPYRGLFVPRHRTAWLNLLELMLQYGVEYKDKTNNPMRRYLGDIAEFGLDNYLEGIKADKKAYKQAKKTFDLLNEHIGLTNNITPTLKAVYDRLNEEFN